MRRDAAKTSHRIRCSLSWNAQTTNQLADHLRINRNTVVNHLYTLLEMKLVEPVPGTWPVVYRRTK